MFTHVEASQNYISSLISHYIIIIVVVVIVVIINWTTGLYCHCRALLLMLGAGDGLELMLVQQIFYPLNISPGSQVHFSKELLMDRASRHHRSLHGTLNTKREAGGVGGREEEGR